MIALALLAIIGTTAARPPDGTYRYALTVGGTPYETSTVLVTSTPQTVSVHDALSMPIARVTGTATALYDATSLKPSGYSADLMLPNGPQHTDVAFVPGAVTISVPGQHVVVKSDPKAPLEVIGDNFPGTMIMLPAVLHATGAHSYTLAVLSGGRAIVAMVTSAPHQQRPAGVPAKDVAIQIDAGGIREVYWYDPATYVVSEVDIPAQNAQLTLTGRSASVAPLAAPAALPTPLPTPQPHFTSRDIFFTSADGTRLAGTLTIPDGDTSRAAAVVLVHGSGAADRNEAIGPNSVFLQLSNALSNAGYVVLRYDKRGIAKSGGNGASMTRDELLQDVEAAFRFLHRQASVDPRHIYLLGHSEGGELVPTVAARTRGVAGIILMAPPALPLARIIMQQTLDSVPSWKRSQTRRKEQRFLASLRDGRRTGPGMAWLRTSLDIDPVTDIKHVHVPVLILQGAADAQVLRGDLPRLVAAARSGNRDVTARVFPGDNHLFMAVPGNAAQTPLQALHQYLTVPARIDPRMTRMLISWLGVHSNGGK